MATQWHTKTSGIPFGSYCPASGCVALAKPPPPLCFCRPFRDSEVAKGCSEMKRTPSQPLSLTALAVFLRFRSLFCKWVGQHAGLCARRRNNIRNGIPITEQVSGKTVIAWYTRTSHGFSLLLQTPPEKS